MSDDDSIDVKDFLPDETYAVLVRVREWTASNRRRYEAAGSKISPRCLSTETSRIAASLREDIARIRRILRKLARRGEIKTYKTPSSLRWFTED